MIRRLGTAGTLPAQAAAPGSPRHLGAQRAKIGAVSSSPALIAIPTQRRAAQLDTTLRSIKTQADARGVEILVIDDGPDSATQQTAQRHGVRYVAAGDPGGLNAARNLAFAESDAPLVILIDDDVRAWPTWLDELLAAEEREPEDVAVLAGRIAVASVLSVQQGPAERWLQQTGAPDHDLALWRADRGMSLTAPQREIAQQRDQRIERDRDRGFDLGR